MVSVTIGLVSRGVEPDSLQISESLFNISTASFTVPDVEVSIAIDVGTPVEIHDGLALIFSGTITEASAELVDGVYRKWSVSCQDHNAALSRRIAGEYEWNKEKANNIFRSILQNGMTDEGLDYSSVAPNGGPEIERFNIVYPTVDDALKSLSSVSNRYYRIEYDRSVSFKEFATGTNRGTITDTSNDARNISSKVTRENYANLVTVRFANVLDTFTDTLTAGTSQKDYPTSKPVVEKPVVKVNGSEQSVGLKDVETGKQVYWQKDSSTISFDVAPSSGASIEITYTGRTTSIADAIDFAAIDERKAVEGGSGVYHRLIELQTETSAANAQAIADATLARLKQLSTVISVESDSIRAVPGETLTVNVSDVPNGTYVVRAVTTQLLGASLLRRSFELVSGNLLADAVSTFSSFTGSGDSSIGGFVSLTTPADSETDNPFGVPAITEPSITVEYVKTEGGILKAKITGGFKTPADLGAAPYKFAGIQLFQQKPNSDITGLFDLGFIDCKDLDAEAPVVIDKDLYVDLPTSDETWFFYFLSRSETKQNAIVLVKSPADVNETPNVVVPVLSTLEVPDVLGFKAGGYDDATATWSQVAEYDTLQERAKVEWGCVKPDSLNFGGVEMWVRPNPDETWYLTGGVTEAKAFLNNQTFQAVYVEGPDLPVDGGIWDYMAVSVDRNGVRKLDEDGQPTGPVLAVAIPAKNGDVSFATPSPVTDLDFSVDSLHGVELALITATFTAPSSGFAGVELWLVEDGSDPFPLGKFPIADSGPATITAEFRTPEAEAEWTLYAASYTSNVSAKLDLTTTPTATKTVEPYPLAAAITDLDANIEYRTNDGSKLVEYRFTATWTEPADPPFWYAQIVFDNGTDSYVIGEDDDGEWVSGWFTAPLTPVPATIKFYSINHARKRNNLSYAYADVVIGAAVGSAGVEWAPVVTSFSASIAYRVSGDGVEQWRLYGTFTPSSDPKYAGCRIVVQDYGGRYTTVQDLNASDNAFTGDWWTIGGTETFTAYALSKDATGRINTVAIGVTPRITGLVVALQTVGSIPGSRLATGTVNLPSFASGLRPIQIVGSLPSLPSSTYPQGALVFLTSDNRVYRSTGSGWTAEVPTTFLSGQITTTQITDNSISTPKLQANSVTTTNLAAGSVTASILAANSVIAGKIQAGAITASEIATSTITGTQMANGAISDVKISDVSISKITSGTTFVSGNMVWSGTGGIQLLGGGSIFVSPGSISAATYNATSLGQGWVISGGSFSTITYTGTSSATINASAYGISGSTVINSSSQFVGAGVNTPFYGIAGSGFNPYSSGVQYFGQTLTGGRMITGVRNSGGVIQYSYRDFDVRGGSVTYISSEFGWFNA